MERFQLTPHRGASTFEAIGRTKVVKYVVHSEAKKSLNPGLEIESYYI